MLRGSHALALAVLIAALLLVIMSWRSARDREMRSAREQFTSYTTELSELLRLRMAQYELVTRGGVSLFASVARPTPQQWRGYVEGMEIEHRFPAVIGLGFAGYVSSARLGDLQLEWRDSGYGLLNLRPRGVRAEYGPVLYLEPRRPENVAAVGFDMLADPVRQHAMLAAIRTGHPQLTGPVQLVQDGATKRTSLLLYLPVYRAGDSPRTESARLASAQGWIYVPFHVDEFARRALQDRLEGTHLHVVDVTDGGNTLLHNGGKHTAEPAFRRSLLLDVYGRRWRLDFESPPVQQAVPGLAAQQGTLALGLIAALFLYGMAFSLAQVETRARRMALTLTEDYRRSELRFRSAMQYSAIGKALLDSRGLIVETNASFHSMIGRDGADLMGQDFATLFSGGGSEPAPKGDADGVWRTMRRIKRDDGTVRHVHVTYSPVPGNVGQDVTGLAQLDDVTERLLAEARVHALNRTLEARVEVRTRELTRANQELESFAYSVSHDLRAPLRAIDGFSRILTERYSDSLDEAGRGYLSRVRRAAGRMGELIDAMLQLSRLTRSPLKLEPVDLSRVAQETLEDLQLADPARSVKVEVQPDLQVVGDATLLRNLLANLLGNAWKFTQGREPAHIAFGLDESGDYFVRDNGAGFSQDYVDKLFRPFQRLHTEDQFTGHGIGLATVRRIVERHGGSIRAEGAEGEGATFWFTLPGAAED